MKGRRAAWNQGCGLVVIALLAVLGACDKEAQVAQAVEVDRNTVCSLDGMTLSDFPGPKGQIHYASGAPDFFCDTMELLSIYLRPEQKRAVKAALTQDMARADWRNPQGNWIDARSAFYVLGSDMKGSMGPTLASFARREDAQGFAQKHGGKVFSFNEITPEVVQLDGGVLRDEKM